MMWVLCLCVPCAKCDKAMKKVDEALYPPTYNPSMALVRGQRALVFKSALAFL